MKILKKLKYVQVLWRRLSRHDNKLKRLKNMDNCIEFFIKKSGTFLNKKMSFFF